MPRMLAFYLPQFHEIPENNEWWGDGFTEWVNVAKARPLFKGHYQPHIPADLGFYDLSSEKIRIRQSELAREAGIEGFCYWHYWFGNGRRLLEKPFNEVLESRSPNFPFCLAWANHSWYKKNWDPNSKDKDTLLIEQKYYGKEDYEKHFYCLLEAFKDDRYIRVDNKILFFIYNVIDFPDVETFIKTWRILARKNGLNDFYLVARDSDSRYKNRILEIGFDAVYNDNIFNIHHHLSKHMKIYYWLNRRIFKKPTIFQYKDAIKFMITDEEKKLTSIPVIAPNWDHSPRSGGNAIILQGSNPKLFKKLVINALKIIDEKPEQHKIILIKAWNEWGEGNHLEPDIKYGRQYLNAIHDVLF